MKRGLQGHHATVSMVGKTVKAFIPDSLPPSPALEMAGDLQKKRDEPSYLLGKLDGVANLLPDVGVLLYMFIRKEAVLSSQIEGPQSPLFDLLLFELKEKPSMPVDDVQEVSNYVAAMTYGLKRLGEGFPLSLHLIRKIHAELLAKGCGSSKILKNSGTARTGLAVPVREMRFSCRPRRKRRQDAWANEEMHDESASLLVKAALSHVQFETIHPFLNGNGRVGRLLITLLL